MQILLCTFDDESTQRLVREIIEPESSAHTFDCRLKEVGAFCRWFPVDL